MGSIMEELLTLCLAKGLKITAAESCTGGMVVAALTDLAGSSAIFERGFVTYSNQAKVEMLGVSAETLDKFGAVSEQVVLEMAQGAKNQAKADIAIAISGIAGPGGSDHKPEGRVCFAICRQNKNVAQTIEFTALGRPNVRAAARDHALGLLLNAAIRTQPSQSA